MKVLILFLTMTTHLAIANQPNIIFIMLDDMDILDLNKYQPNTLIHTPYLDSFFDENKSLVFENYYSSGPNCSQTRSSLLSGQYPIQNNFLKTLEKKGSLGISIDFPMISEKLKEVGYYTATIGKWHVGLDGDPTYRPENRGFDYSTLWYEDICEEKLITCPIIENDNGIEVSNAEQYGLRKKLYPNKYFAYNLIKQNSLQSNPIVSCHQVFNEVNGLCTAPVLGNYLPNRLTNEAVDLIDTVNDTIRSTPAHEPFFINLWYYTPHTATNVPPNYNLEFDCLLGSTDPACNYQIDYTVINDQLTFLENCNGGERSPACDNEMGQYAAQMTYLDRKIKSVVDKIEKMYAIGKLNNETLIIITSDNGGAPSTHSNWGGDETQHENRTDSKLCTNGNETNCNIKYRGSKNQLFERGIRVPLAIKRFGRQNNNTKGLNNEFITSRDFFPTLIQLTTGSLDRFNYYGINFSGVVQENSELSFFEKTRSEFWQMKPGSAYEMDFPTNYDEFIQNGNQLPFPDFETDYTGDNSYKQNQQFAVRQGDWKLIHEPQKLIKEGLVNDFPEFKDEIYDLYQIDDTDDIVDEYIGSKQNLERPDLVKFLQNQYYKWRNLIGFVDYSFDISPNIVDSLIDIKSHCPDANNCQTVRINHSTRLNISSEQFTYANFVKINNNGSTCGTGTNGLADGNGVISFKPGDLVNGVLQPHSWKLKILAGKPVLSIWVSNIEQNISEKVELEYDQQLSCGVIHHLAFTIQGSRPVGHGQLIKLFVDGVEVKRKTLVNYFKTDNTARVGFDVCTDQDVTTYCPSHWVDPTLGSRPRVANSHRKVFIGNDVQKNKIFDGFISVPLISSTTLSNEEVRILSLTHQMNQDYTSNQINYIPCIDSSPPCTKSAAADGILGPMFDEKLNAWFFPFDGEDGLGALNNVVLEVKDDPNNLVNLSLIGDQISFSTKIRLNKFAMKLPQATNVIAKQTTYIKSTNTAANAWQLMIARNNATTEQNDGIIKFDSWFGSCKLTLKTQGTDPTAENFAIIKEGEAHDVVITIDKKTKTTMLYLDGEKMLSGTAASTCGDMYDYDNMYLGNSYRNCSIQGDPYSCQAFDGLIYSPRISNQILSADAIKWESRTQFLE